MKRVYDSLLNAFDIKKGINTNVFIAGISVVGPFFLIAKALTLGLQATAGRLMGPNEFGIVNIIIAISSILLIPLQLGFPVIVSKFAAMEDSHDKQTIIISSTLWSQLIWVIVCCIVLYLTRFPIADIFKIPVETYNWSLFHACFMTLNIFLLSSLQGVKLFYERGKSEFVYALVSIAVFIPLYYFIPTTFHSYVIAVIAGMISAGVLVIHRIHFWIKLKLNLSSVFSVKAYTVAPLVNNCFSAILATVSPLLLAYYLSASEVGIFGAYRLGTFLVSGVLSSTISIVLFPMTSSPSLQPGAWRKFFRLNILIFAISFVIFIISCFAILKLVGKAYPVKLLWISLFSLSATLSLLFNIGSTLLYSLSPTGQWAGVTGNILTGIMLLGISFLLIPKYGLTGAVSALTTSYGFGALWCYLYGWRKVICKIS